MFDALGEGAQEVLPVTLDLIFDKVVLRETAIGRQGVLATLYTAPLPIEDFLDTVG
jgi:hypothetical protein